MKLISCFLPADRADGLIHALKEERGVDTATVGAGRGIGAGQCKAFGTWDEIAVVTLTAEDGEADDLFAFVFEAAELDRPKGGLVYMQALGRATPFVLPDVPAEEEG